MRYAMIRDMDISNGLGIGVSIFFQGCKFHCNNCFNKSTWDFNGGKRLTNEVIDKFVEISSNNNIDHISILGGEPLQQNLYELNQFIKRINKEVGKPIIMWTGYTYENLSIEQLEVIKNVDILIDGQFIQELYDPRLLYRGSSNQRVIDVQKSLKSSKIVLLDIQDIVLNS